MYEASSLPHHRFVQRPPVAILLVVALAACSDTTPVGAPRFAICAGPHCGSDQGQLVIDNAANTIAIGGADSQKVAQVVTPDSTGQVVEIKMPVGCDGTDLRVEIESVDAVGKPTPPVRLAQRTPNSQVPSPLDGTFRDLNLGGGFSVTAGTRFAIVLSVVDPAKSCGVQQGPVGDLYAYGDGWFAALPNPLDVWEPISLGTDRFDLPFETFVRLRP
jgi:hypothetical protein